MVSFGAASLCSAAVGSCDSFPGSQCMCLSILVPRFGRELSLLTKSSCCGFASDRGAGISVEGLGSGSKYCR
jgi:hypothetical protein